MDWGTAGQWAGVVVAIVIATWGAFSRRDQQALVELQKTASEDRRDRKAEASAMQHDLRRLFERVDGVEARVGKVEVEVEHLPSKEEVHAIDVKITAMVARFDAMADRLNTLINLYERAQDRLAEAEGRR